MSSFTFMNTRLFKTIGIGRKALVGALSHSLYQHPNMGFTFEQEFLCLDGECSSINSRNC